MTVHNMLQSPERDVLLVSALISIIVVLAFTDWGILAYVLTGLVFAALFLASAIANARAAGRPAADRRSQGGATAWSTTAPRRAAGWPRLLSPDQTERS